MTVLFDEAIRQLLEEYAVLQAEHQGLSAGPPDGRRYEAHTVKLYMHMCRVQFILEELRQQSREAGQRVWGSEQPRHNTRN